MVEVRKKQAEAKSERKILHKTQPLQSMGERFNKFIAKIKTLRNKELWIATALGLVIVLVFVSSFGGSQKQSAATADSDSNAAYVTMMETRLSEVLQKISGAGKVEVMVTLKEGARIITATSTDTHINTSIDPTGNGDRVTENKTETSTPVIITDKGSSSPLIIQEIAPVVKGVIIVAEGADQTAVKLELLRACQALLGVSSDNIEIFKMDSKRR